MRLPSAVRSTRFVVAVAAVCGTAGIATLVAGGSSAQADPSFVSGYAGVGSDVSQDVFAAFSGASPAPPAANTHWYTPLSSSAANKVIESFDASPSGGTTTNPGCITTKLGGPSFDRPNSSTAGIAALYDAVNGTPWQNSSASCTGTGVNVTGQIDFARSARPPKTAGTTLTFIPFSRDGLAIAYFDHKTGHLATLTTAELTALYSSSTGTATIGGDTVHACLTISGSTPRSNLETVLGLSDSTVSAAATAAGCNNIQQNSGNSFYSAVSSFASGVDAVIPISGGSWISQANGVAVDRSDTARSNGVDLAAIDALGKPYTGSAPSETPSTTYDESTYGYDLYVVVPTAKISGAFGSDADLTSLFAGSTSSICSSAAQTTAHTFGFDSLNSAEGLLCGDTSTTGNS